VRQFRRPAGNNAGSIGRIDSRDRGRLVISLPFADPQAVFPAGIGQPHREILGKTAPDDDIEYG
jgi:hypothetical protein